MKITAKSGHQPEKTSRISGFIIAVFALTLFTVSCKNNAENKENAAVAVTNGAKQAEFARTAEDQSKFTAEDVINRFKEGNMRFTSNKLTTRDLPALVRENSQVQHPLAVVLSCMDSRIPPETVFDESIGDVFVVRVAGNVVNNDILGSMEYGCKVSGAKLILVLGHENCGAVKSAIKEVKMGNITSLLQKVKPAIDKSASYPGDKSYKNHDFIDLVCLNNVFVAINEIKARSPILKEMADKGEIRIVGAVYDMNTGIVKFLE